jgi:hypothetical protein
VVEPHMPMSSRDKGKELCWKVFGDMVPEIILCLRTSMVLDMFSKIEDLSIFPNQQLWGIQ